MLWTDPASRVIHATPEGSDILNGAVKRDDTASDVLYFKVHVDPLSDAASEPYYALFQLSQNGTNRLGIGNALEAWGFSAAYTSERGPENKEATDGEEYNLKSAHPEGLGLGKFQPYELPSHDHDKMIVFRVQYVPHGDDLVTVWLDPDLSHSATPESQPENLTTKFKADCSFDQIRLRHGGDGGPQHDGGNGWIFGDMAIATSFSDFLIVHFWQTWWFRGLVALLVLAGVGTTARVMESRKYRLQLQQAEQRSALEQERTRIAQDLHDELGSLLTRISLIGGLLQVDKDKPEQIAVYAGKISEAADQTVRSLEQIVWAVRPGSDSLQSLAEYLAHFANELFDGSSMRCRLDLPQDLPDRVLPPDLRHNIFLIAKEALTNALRHAHGSVVHLELKVQQNRLKLVVADDGRGFASAPPTQDGKHNGLGNMRRRAEAIGGQILVTSEPGKGTRVVFELEFRG